MEMVRKEDYDRLKLEYDQMKFEYKSLIEEYQRARGEIIDLRRRLSQPVKKVGSIEYVDDLKEIEFEEYMTKLLSKLKYDKIKTNKVLTDYKLNLVAEKDYMTYSIYCRLDSNILGVDAIDEAIEFRDSTKKNVSIILTNSRFADDAISYAKSNNIVLWDRDVLVQFLEQTTMTNNSDEEYEEDDLYDTVEAFVKELEHVSTSIIQRRFKLGYNRSARLIDTLEKNGIIGPMMGSKPRIVLIRKEN